MSFLKKTVGNEKRHFIRVAAASDSIASRDTAVWIREDNDARRTVRKSGFCSMRKKRVPRTGWKYQVTDPFTALVDSRWRWTLLIFTLSFLVTWFLFGILWWIIAYGHGDLRGSQMHDPGKEPCVTEIYDFVSAFMFSLETQYTTGYGNRSPTAECPEAVFLLCVQSIFGVLLQAVMTGIVFAKLARPKYRSSTILFSQQAVVCLRDGHLCLMFRVGDARKSHIVGATLRAWLLQHRVSPEGERLYHYQHALPLSVDNGGSDVFLLWPVTAVHRIDASSPLYDISAAALSSSQMEVVVALTGTAETTGQTSEARTSYLPKEIQWGRRFENLLRKGKSCFGVDYSLFEQSQAVDTPVCSARQLYYSRVRLISSSNNTIYP